MIRNWIVALGFVTVLFSCYERKEGCLDQLASNYSVNVDDNCQNCCTYPSINLQIAHLWNGQNLRFNDTLTPNVGPRIILLDQALYLNQFKVTTTEHDSLDLRNAIEFTIEGKNIVFPKDLVIIKKNQSQVTFQNYRGMGQIDSICFTMGLPHYIHQLSLDQAILYEPLKLSNNMLDADSNYVSYKLNYLVEPNFNDTISILFKDSFAFKKIKSIPIMDGSDLNIPIQIDYNNWFENINFGESREQIITLLRTNSSRAIE